MHLKHTEHDLREITNFDKKILMYAEILDLCVIWKKKRLCSSRAQNFLTSLAKSGCLFIY